MANEPFSALVIAFGFEPERPRIEVVLEPRNRTLAYRALTVVARAFVPWFRSLHRPQPPQKSPGEDSSDAPQLVVPNEATVELLGRWGRRLAYLSGSGDMPVDPLLPEMGAHLQFLTDHSRIPGQSLVVPMTSLLRRHWITGQSSLEDENLAALDAWIDPPAGKHGYEAASAVEDVGVGPLLQPDVENEIFEIIRTLNQARGGSTDPSLCGRLRPRLEGALQTHVQTAWKLLWKCADRERQYSEGTHVGGRWSGDCRSYATHLEWMTTGARRSARDSVKRAANLRILLEDAKDRIDAQEAFDDPLTMAQYELSGRAIRGRVLSVQPNKEIGPGGRRHVSRPLITIELEGRALIARGKELWWAGHDGVQGIVTAVTDSPRGGFEVTLKIVTGIRGRLPAVGETVCFSTLTTGSGLRMPLPKEVPWTHQPSSDATRRGMDEGSGAQWEGTDA